MQEALRIIANPDATLEQLQAAEAELTEQHGSMKQRIELAEQDQDAALDRLSGKEGEGRAVILLDRQRMIDLESVIAKAQERIQRAQEKIEAEDRGKRLQKTRALLQRRQEVYTEIGSKIEEIGAMFSEVVRLGKEAEAVSPYIKTRRDMVNAWGYRPAELAIHLTARFESELGNPYSLMNSNPEYLQQLLISQRSGGLAGVLKPTESILLGPDMEPPEAA
jgi:hypothetical protein